MGPNIPWMDLYLGRMALGIMVECMDVDRAGGLITATLLPLRRASPG